MRALIAMGCVFLGCCANVIYLELLVREEPKSGNIVTFTQFLVISLYGLFVTVKFFTEPTKIPISRYIVMVSIFFVVQVVNNMALGYNISMPLHMIFRSGSLMANLILGVIIQKHRYSTTKYLSVGMITIGIVVCTIVSAGEPVRRKAGADTTEGLNASEESSAAADASVEFVRWLIGIAMLVFALFSSAYMGIYQEQTYSAYGKHPDEALFYNHALPLPGFLLAYSDIITHYYKFNASEPYAPIPGVPYAIPVFWYYTIAIAFTYFVCIKSVFILTSECRSLTVTLVVTLRKFVSLLISIYWFQNPFTPAHWFGTFLVFTGTLLFCDVHTSLLSLFKQDKAKKQ